MKLAVIRTGGKQYLVSENDEIIVDAVNHEPKETIMLDTLAIADKTLELGNPLVKKGVKAEVLENFRGKKMQSHRFKAKVRYRKTVGYRPSFSKLKILAF